MKIRIISFLLFISSLVSCEKEVPEITSNTGKLFIMEVLDIMEEHSINKQKIDWSAFREKVLKKTLIAQTIVDTYPAIREALALLEDNHSSYIKNDGSSIFAGTLKCGFTTIDKPIVPENIGYVKVNFFSGSANSASAIAFAEDIQNQIITQNTETVKGWIVDLRNNGGGNMWPMIAGSGSLLGEGTAGYFIDPDNNQTSWGYLNGASVANGNVVTQMNNPVDLIIPNPKVAVLLNNGIASSGEVMAISFIGRENTKSFGAPTCGLSTSNRTFSLSDNSILNLTTAFLADRDKTLYGIPIEPDVVVNSENIIQSAVEWIQN